MKESSFGLADAFASGLEVIQRNRRAADRRVGLVMVKEAREGFKADLAGAPEPAVADQGRNDGAGGVTFAFVVEFAIEADAVHCFGV